MLLLPTCLAALAQPLAADEPLYVKNLSPVTGLLGLPSQRAAESEQAGEFSAALHSSVSNVYVLDGGIGSWLSLFSALPGGPLEAGALGARQPASAPDITLVQLPEFEKKVKLAAQGKKKSGGCGG